MTEKTRRAWFFWGILATSAEVGLATASWPVNEILPTRNALVHLSSFIDGGSRTVPPPPRFFNAFALDYDSIPTVSGPAEWLEFLRQIWEDDNESIIMLARMVRLPAHA